MRDTRRRYDASFKAKVALEVIKGERTVAEIASESFWESRMREICTSGSSRGELDAVFITVTYSSTQLSANIRKYNNVTRRYNCRGHAVLG